VKRQYEFGDSIPTAVTCPDCLRPSQLLIQPDDTEEYDADFCQFALVVGIDRKIIRKPSQGSLSYDEVSDEVFDEIIAKIAKHNDEKHVSYTEWMSLMGCISCYPLDEEIKKSSIDNHYLYYYSPNNHGMTDPDYPKNYLVMSERNNNSISSSRAIIRWMSRNNV
jgi:hypothetical protein